MEFALKPTSETSNPSDETTRAYYDAFAERYDDKRGGNVRGGYHDLIDELEVGFVRSYAEGKDVLEVGCGTGLLLHRFAQFARRAEGIDLSEEMVARARARGLSASVATITELPFSDETFDVTCALKVLPHVPAIEDGIREMFRVTRRGGIVIMEVYNPSSLRALTKRLFGPKKTSRRFDEAAILTRFDTPRDIQRWVPTGATLVAERGVRIVTPTAAIFALPLVATLVREAERKLCDGPLRRFGGFYLAAYRKH